MLKKTLSTTCTIIATMNNVLDITIKLRETRSYTQIYPSHVKT